MEIFQEKRSRRTAARLALTGLYRPVTTRSLGSLLPQSPLRHAEHLDHMDDDKERLCVDIKVDWSASRLGPAIDCPIGHARNVDRYIKAEF